MRDYKLVTIIGVLVGALVLIPARNLGVSLNLFYIAASIFGFGIFAPIALSILKLLARKWRVLEQFGKFAAVGTLNTLVDLGVLNLLILLTEVSSGLPYAGFKTLSFVAGTTNSYFWNKFWTFGSKASVTAREYARFAVFTLVGAGINVAVATSIVTFVGDGGKIFANIGALVGVFAALFWNFLSYRKFVFKSSANNELKTNKRIEN